jgi:hypothetical protein
MNVMSILMGKLKAGDVLVTPVRAKKFKVESISPSSITLILGKKWRTPIPANCWNGIPNYLKGKDWVEIGAIHGISKPGTLENYIDGFVPRSAGNYVASILEHAGIVEIDRNLPSKVRLV